MAHRLGDDDLHELLRAVDGDDIDTATAERVEALCNEDPNARQAREDLISSRALMDLALAGIEKQPLSPELERHVDDWFAQTRRDRWRLPLRAVAAGALIAVLSATAGWQLAVHRAIDGGMARDTLVQAVLDYQVLYTRATLDHVNAAPGDRQRTSQRLSQALGAPLEIPDLSDHGLEFKRGQVLALDDRPVVQIVYLPAFGQPVAYCLSPQAGADTAPVRGVDRGLDYVTWRQDGIAHVLVGAGFAEELQSIGKLLAWTVVSG